jgi:tetratricopeptide (TPR) repeat protein
VTARLVPWLDEAPLAERLELTGNAYRSALASTDRSDPIFLEIQAVHGANLCRVGQGREGLELIRSAVDASRQRHGTGVVTERLLGILWWNLAITGDVAAGLETAREAYDMAVVREPAGRSNRGIRALNVLVAALLARRIEGLAPVLADLELASQATRDLQQAAMVWLLIHQGQTAGASQLAQHAIEAATRAKASDFVTTARLGWSYALLEDGKPEQAERVLPPVGKDLKPANPVDGDDVLKEHAAVQLALGNSMQALSLADESIRLALTVKRQTDPHLSDLHLTRGRALLNLGRVSEARDSFRISDEFWRRYEPASPWAAEASYWLARALIEAGDATAGGRMLKSAQARLAKSPMPSHRTLAAARAKSP